MNIANIITGEIASEVPLTIVAGDVTINGPSWLDCLAAGWREVTSVEEPEPGRRITAFAPSDNNDGATCRLVATHTVSIAQECLDKMTAADIAKAQLFRSILRAQFGANAETNPDIGYTAVMNHFAAKRMSGTITASDAGDMVFLEKLFKDLLPFGADGVTTWSLPWSLIP